MSIYKVNIFTASKALCFFFRVLQYVFQILEKCSIHEALKRSHFMNIMNEALRKSPRNSKAVTFQDFAELFPKSLSNLVMLFALKLLKPCSYLNSTSNHEKVVAHPFSRRLHCWWRKDLDQQSAPLLRTREMC